MFNALTSEETSYIDMSILLFLGEVSMAHRGPIHTFPNPV